MKPIASFLSSSEDKCQVRTGNNFTSLFYFKTQNYFKTHNPKSTFLILYISLKFGKHQINECKCFLWILAFCWTDVDGYGY